MSVNYKECYAILQAVHCLLQTTGPRLNSRVNDVRFMVAKWMYDRILIQTFSFPLLLLHLHPFMARG